LNTVVFDHKIVFVHYLHAAFSSMKILYINMPNCSFSTCLWTIWNKLNENCSPFYYNDPTFKIVSFPLVLVVRRTWNLIPGLDVGQPNFLPSMWNRSAWKQGIYLIDQKAPNSCHIVEEEGVQRGQVGIKT